MNGFDDQLREALRRRQPPEDFSEKVLARIRQQPAPRPRSSFRAWMAVAAAAVMLMTVVGLPAYREHTRRIKGERAKEQVMLTLRMTGATLRRVQERVQQHTVELLAQ